jgi:hypothetical protein
MDTKNEECYKLKYEWDICSSKIFFKYHNSNDTIGYYKEMNPCFEFYKKFHECLKFRISISKNHN